MAKANDKPSANDRVYRVTACSQDYYSILVKANSEEEAREIGESVDGGYFRPDHPGDWEIIRAEQVEQFRPDELIPTEAYGSL